jgi:hypothetical protein
MSYAEDQLSHLQSMVPKFSILTTPQLEPVKFHLFLEKTQTGSTIASVSELPDCQVEAPTQEEAILALQPLLANRLENIKVLPFEVQMPDETSTDNPWIQFAGMFKDDPDFAEIVNDLRAERECDE